MSLNGNCVLPLGQGNLQVDFGRRARSKRTPAIHQYSPGLDRMSGRGRGGCLHVHGRANSDVIHRRSHGQSGYGGRSL